MRGRRRTGLAPRPPPGSDPPTRPARRARPRRTFPTAPSDRGRRRRVRARIRARPASPRAGARRRAAAAAAAARAEVPVVEHERRIAGVAEAPGDRLESPRRPRRSRARGSRRRIGGGGPKEPGRAAPVARREGMLLSARVRCRFDSAQYLESAARAHLPSWLILAVGADRRGRHPCTGGRVRAAERLPRAWNAPAYNKVGVLKVGREHARNVLILNPGTSASAAYFAPLAKTIAQRAKRWQVWAVERRENLLEDHSVADRVRAEGLAAPAVRLLPRLPDRSERDHPLRGSPGFPGRLCSRVGHARRRRGSPPGRGGRTQAPRAGGHGRPLARRIDHDRLRHMGLRRPARRRRSRRPRLHRRRQRAHAGRSGAGEPVAKRPRGGLAMAGLRRIPAPFAGLFNIVGSTLARVAPDAPSPLHTWPLLPANLKPPVLPTNEGGYGYALDTETSPPNLAAAQAHLGRLAASGDPRGWERAGELTPVQRYAAMFSGTGLRSLDGTAWYHPRRLSIDSERSRPGTQTRRRASSTCTPRMATTSGAASASTPSAAPWAASACSTPPARSPPSPASPPGSDAGGPPRDVFPQRSQLGEPEQRLRRGAAAVPAADQAALGLASLRGMRARQSSVSKRPRSVSKRPRWVVTPAALTLDGRAPSRRAARADSGGVRPAAPVADRHVEQEVELLVEHPRGIRRNAAAGQDVAGNAVDLVLDAVGAPPDAVDVPAPSSRRRACPSSAASVSRRWWRREGRGGLRRLDPLGLEDVDLADRRPARKPWRGVAEHPEGRPRARPAGRLIRA